MNNLREECASSRSNSKMEKRREPRKRSLCEQKLNNNNNTHRKIRTLRELREH